MSFVVLPKDASGKLPRRGRTTVEGTINGHHFQAMLEPDGRRSHYLRVPQELYQAAGADVGERVTLEIMAVEQEPEPEVSRDVRESLDAAPEARRTWDDTTTLARLDWIHWIVLGYDSKALRAPEAADEASSP